MPNDTPSPQTEKLNELVIAVIDSIIARHTSGENLNVDLTAIATGLESGRIARMAGLKDLSEIFRVVAATAPQEMSDIGQWHWPEGLPLDDTMFAQELAALRLTEAEHMSALQNDEDINPLHVALSLGMYAVHLAVNAQEHVDPLTVLGVYQEAAQRGFGSYSLN